ncbi:MAG: amidohydrolase family protein [Terriglobia bacterium]
MNRRQSLAVLSGAAIGIPGVPGRGRAAAQEVPGPEGPITPDKLLLKDYRPRSIYKIAETKITRAKYPVIDCHTHPYARTAAEVDQWVKNMDAVGLEKGVVMTMATGERFQEVGKRFTPHRDRFELWCGFDLTQFGSAGFERQALEALERCHEMGATGVGELVDKGRGFGARAGRGPAGRRTRPTGPRPHPDDPELDALFERCGKLGMPVSIHVSDPPWAYEPMDQTNDGLMNGYKWRIDVKPGVMGHRALIESLERAVKKHPQTIFFACHLTNQCNDLSSLGGLLDRNPNLYADIGARYAETACVPRSVAQFFSKHSDRILYGTDMGFDQEMYRTTFRILETADEHFYHFQFGYHWYLNGFNLPDALLKKIYRDNALAAFARARQNMA